MFEWLFGSCLMRADSLAVAALTRGSGQLVVLSLKEQVFLLAFALGVELGYIRRPPNLFVSVIDEVQEFHK